jgi:hypothetical protein
MKKLIKVMLIVFVVICSLFTTVQAASNESSKETLKNESTHTILEMKKHEEATIENLTEQYGSHTYGVTAYILDRIRIYSIPCVFLGLAISAVYQYVIGLKRLDARNIGFNGMIAIITIGIICQILPLIFAIVVTRDGN